MALLKENINNLIADDLNKRNQNWTTIEDSLELKADKTEVNASLEIKADKTYVDNKVKTDVPVGAKFTDTVYSHPASHPASMITGLPTSLPANGGNADTVGGFTVGVSVPANAKFTDTVVDISGKADKTYVDNQDALKADKTEVAASLELKADKTEVNASLELKADKTYVDNQDALKADKTELIASLELKADKTYVDSLYIDAGGSIDLSLLELKADKTYVDSQDALKADKTYVDGKVQTDVPSGAVFTDTITTINGKTGAISKADIVALGIPSQDTVYSHPSTHPASMITESSTKRFVSDSEKSTWNSKSDTDTVTTINGKTGVISKDDIVALGIPAQDTNTTYDEITTTEIDAGTASTLRTITGRRVKYILDKVQGWIGGLTKSDVGLSNVDNLSAESIRSGTTKAQVGLGNVTNDKQMPISGGVLENYREKLVTLSGTSTTINLSLGNVFTHTLTGNTTYSITNAVNSQAHSFTLIITQTATVRTLTFPASVKWQGGETPDLTTASKTYVLTFMSVDGGSSWLGMFGGEF